MIAGLRTVPAWFLASALLLPGPGATAQEPGPRESRVEAAAFRVELTGDSARVDAFYRLESDGGRMEWTAMRFPAQELEVEGVEAGGRVVGMTTEESSYGMRMAPGSPGRVQVLMRYHLTGDLSRIPLYVPEVAAPSGEEAVELRVLGLDSLAVLDAGFPRLEETGEGYHRALLDHVPGFIHLPPSQEPLTVNRLTDLLVVLLVLGATAAWLWFRRRRAPGAPGAPDAPDEAAG